MTPQPKVGDSITTAYELYRLPADTVVISDDGYNVYHRAADGLWNKAAASTRRWISSEILDYCHTVTVIYLPEGNRS